MTREDRGPLLLIAALPLLVALPQLAGWLNSDPLIYTGRMAVNFVEGIARGVPYIDPNNGFQTQALGVRSALDWLAGTVPWWNPYTGVGLPLAGEYQPGSFDPLIFLLLLPRGPVLLQLALQILSGWGTYAFLRAFGLQRPAATVGGILFAFNGTLAWFAHGPAQPVPFLPWTLWAIERNYRRMAAGAPPAWRALAAALAMSLLAAFPETAFIDGLLAMAWTGLRTFQLPRDARAAFTGAAALGAAIAVCIALPQLVAFFMYLPQSQAGAHFGGFADSALGPSAILPTLFAPYVFGSIFGYAAQWTDLYGLWGGIGGFASLTLVLAAVYGFLTGRRAAHVLLLAWIVLALGKTFHLQPFLWMWNHVPGVTSAAFARYAPPSWELALVVLAACGLDQLLRDGIAQRRALIVTAAIGVAGWIAATAYIAELWPHLGVRTGLRNSALVSALWAGLSATACLHAIARFGRSRSLRYVAAVLVVDAALMVAYPTLSSPRAGEPDMAGIQFLQRNLGLQRFFTTGPIQPNYGAYFGIASVNHNYLPVSERWTRWLGTHLDRFSGDGVVFDGLRSTAAAQVLENLAGYRAAGVKYVVTASADSALDAPDAHARDLREVYRDDAMRIFEVPSPAPYFEALDARCAIEATDRTRAAIVCEQPSRVVRRELFFPGWEASVNGRPSPIGVHDELFQVVAVPVGRSEVRYRFAPEGIAWPSIIALLALAALAVPIPRLRPSPR